MKETLTPNKAATLQSGLSAAGSWRRTPGEPDLRDFFTIGDMARTFGVSLRALRFYEDRGLMKPLRHGSIRLYDNGQRSRLQLILRGKSLGFTLTDIAFILSGCDGREPEAFEQVLDAGKISSQIEHLERQRLGIDCAIQELRATHARFCAAGRSHEFAQAAAG